MEDTAGFEPALTILQTVPWPLGYVSKVFGREWEDRTPMYWVKASRTNHYANPLYTRHQVCKISDSNRWLLDLISNARPTELISLLLSICCMCLYFGDLAGIRNPVAGMKTQYPRPLDDEARLKGHRGPQCISTLCVMTSYIDVGQLSFLGTHQAPTTISTKNHN